MNKESQNTKDKKTKRRQDLAANLRENLKRRKQLKKHGQKDKN